jgi:Zn-dependent oligopeptidase
VNSFDHPRGEVHYEAFRAEDVLPALARAEAGALDALDQVPTHPDPLWAFGEASAAYDFIVTIVDDMVGVLGGAWHDVARAADERAARFWTTVCQRRNLYDAIRAVAPSGPVEERLRADLLRRFEHAGAHLDAVDRDRLTAVKARLAELASDFAANLRARTPPLASPPTIPPACPTRWSRLRVRPRRTAGCPTSTCPTPSRTRSSCSGRRRTARCARRCTG